MIRVAEVVYVVPGEREKFLQEHLHPSKEVAQVLWMHGIRNQICFALNELILITFEYAGKNLNEDMEKLAAYPGVGEHMVTKRRKEVPAEEQTTTSWWAPLKKLGMILTESPMPDDEEEELSLEEQYRSMISGYMAEHPVKSDIAFDEDDWSESIHI